MCDGSAVWTPPTPGATADALAGAADFFGAELPALLANRISADDVADLDVPVRNVLGAVSAPRFAESAASSRRGFHTPSDGTWTTPPTC